jgi:hypothetical protein
MTQQQITALQAALAHTGSITQKLDVGIDACRSPEYRERVRAYQAECHIRRERGEGIGDIPAPPAERVPGATQLREFVRAELARIGQVRQSRFAATFVQDTAPLRQRAEAHVRQAVLAAYHECGYRRAKSRWAGGNHAVYVAVSAHPYARGEGTRSWSDNGKWSGNDSIHRIGVTLRWRLDVQVLGLAVVFGCLVVEANYVEPGIYDILVARPGRGFELQTDRCFAARRYDGTWAATHGIATARRMAKRAV